jgi:hypothetical protein
MGAVVSANPSSGIYNWYKWGSSGGTIGSGDISVPYNPVVRIEWRKIPVMGYNHGARTGKKSREKGWYEST